MHWSALAMGLAAAAVLHPAAPQDPAPPPQAVMVHVGDLDEVMARSAPGARNATASIEIWIHDGQHRPVSRARVEASWAGAVRGRTTCETDIRGFCLMTSRSFPNEMGARVTMTITKVEGPEMQFDEDASHDPDKDSDGKRISVSL